MRRLVVGLISSGLLLLGQSGPASAALLGCVILPERQAEVGSPVIGVVESVLVERGDRVSLGQVLAVLQSRVERASLAVAEQRTRVVAELHAAEANLELARSRYSRSEDLYRKAFISSQALEQARAELRVAEEQVGQSRERLEVFESEARLAREQLRQRVLKAPFDGVVVDRLVQPGERVEDRPLFRLAAVDRLTVEVVAPAAQFGAIRQGMWAKVFPDLPSAKPISAKVTLVDSILDAASNTFRVRMSVDNRDGRTPAGARCRVEFPPPSARPSSAAPNERSPSRGRSLRLDTRVSSLHGEQ